MKMTTIPSIAAVQALDGRNFAMLSAGELEVLAFYRDRGRKFDVSVAILSDADPKALERASREQADEIMKRANSHVQVSIGSGAEAEWNARATERVQGHGHNHLGFIGDGRLGDVGVDGH